MLFRDLKVYEQFRYVRDGGKGEVLLEKVSKTHALIINGSFCGGEVLFIKPDEEVVIKSR